MAFTDWEFRIEPPAERDGGWWFGVHGQRAWHWGPFADRGTAQLAELHLFQRWNRAARSRGGWAWKATPRRWVITAPAAVEVHGLPLERAACTQHHAGG